LRELAETRRRIAVTRCSSQPRKGIHASTDVMIPITDPYTGSDSSLDIIRVRICSTSIIPNATYTVDRTINPPKKGMAKSSSSPPETHRITRAFDIYKPLHSSAFHPIFIISC
jgi:hypothetical protein